MLGGSRGWRNRFLPNKDEAARRVESDQKLVV